MLAGSAVSGAAGARGSTQTSNSSSETQQVLTPEQQAALAQLYGFYGSQITDPGAGLTPIKSGLLAGVSTNYTNMMDQLAESNARAGIRPDSGAAAYGRQIAMIQRANAIGGVEEYMAKTMLERKDAAARGLTGLATHSFGSKTTGTSTTKTKGSMLAGAMGGAAEAAGYWGGRKYFGKE